MNPPPAARAVTGLGVWLSLLWVLAVARLLLSMTQAGPDGRAPYVIGFDENCYYVYARSLLFDGDWDFTNDYRFIVETQPSALATPFAEYLRERPRYPRNHFSPGTGLAALPFMGVARVVDHVRAALTDRPLASPFASWYIFAFSLANITYGVGALWLAGYLLRRWFDASAVSFGVWASALTGPYVFYLFYGHGMSHLPVAFFVSLSLVLWLRWREAGGRAGAGWALGTGLAGGMALCARSTSLPLVLVVCLEPLLAAWRRGGAGELMRRVPQGLLAVVAAAVAFSPQLLAWRVMYDSWMANAYGFSARVVPPHALEVLFSRRHGLFFWSPFYLVAAAGLLASVRRGRHPAAAFCLILAGVVWIYGNWRLWWLGVSFGMRGFVDYVALFAFGFAAVEAMAVSRKGPRMRIVLRELAVLFTVVNLHLVHAFRSGAIYVDGPLYWLDSVSHGRQYKEQFRREWRVWTDFRPGSRASLF
jgi:hypothetical protein